MVTKFGRTAAITPFDYGGIVRGEDDVLHYRGGYRSLVHLLSQTSELWPTREALVEHGGRGVSYKQLWEMSAAIAGGLRSQGLHQGDRVAIRLSNSLDWVLAFFGTILAGAVAVPINTRMTEEEAGYIVRDCGATHVFHNPGELPKGKPYADFTQLPSGLAAIFYTSGTTGFPKGAMTSHENFLANSETMIRVAHIDPSVEIRNLVSVPLFHVTGCNSQLIPTLQMGGTVVTMGDFGVDIFLDSIVEDRINFLTAVPAIYWYAMNQSRFRTLDVSGVRWLNYGGAPTSPEQISRMIAAFPLARLGNAFGLTETSSITTFLPHEYAMEHPESVGFAAPPVELDLLGEDSPSGTGELLIRGPNVIKGYWNRPEATAAAFLNGWLRSGDIARLDIDGFCQIVDRKKDMINRGGENVYSTEVENVLAAFPGIWEVAVVAVADEMMGEKVGAVIVCTEGEEPNGGDIREFAKERLAEFKIPQFFSFQGLPLPRNAAGKVQKAALRSSAVWGREWR